MLAAIIVDHAAIETEGIAGDAAVARRVSARAWRRRASCQDGRERSTDEPRVVAHGRGL